MQWNAVNRLLLTGCLFLAGLAFAETGTLRGVVEDDTGAVIPRARVSLKAAAGAGEAVRTLANDLGEFSFNGLALGEYLLHAEADNFKPGDLPVTIGAAPVALQHLRLKIANVNQEISVSGATDPISMDGNMDSVEVNHDLLKSLPAKDNNPLAAAAMFLDPSVNGVEGPKLVVDGIETTDLDVPSSGVKSVAVNKNPYSSEFGRPGRGRIEVVTRPGSLVRVHHHFLMTYRNSSLDATNAFAKQPPSMQKSLFEGDLNGPLFHQNGSFYLGGEYLRDDQSSFIHAITPTSILSEPVAMPQRTGKVLARVDYRLNPANTLSLRYNFSHDSISNEGIEAFDLPTRGYNTVSHGHEFRAVETALVNVNFTNELRFAFKDKDKNISPVSDAPATIVLGAFNSGGAQLRQQQNEKSFEFQDVAGWVHGKHMVRFGVTAKRRAIDVTDRSNFGGTFSFSDLASFAANQPFLFTINQGNPSISFTQNEYSYFIQDEMRLRPDLTLMAGVRHELQSNLHDYNNVAPRVALSWAPGRKDLVFRAGAGIFYDRRPWMMQEQSLLFNNDHIHRVVIQDPDFTQVPAAGFGAVPNSITTISPLIRAPYLMQASAGVDKKFGRYSLLSVDYTTTRGLKLYRTRDINAPLPSTGMAPNSNFNHINQFESTGSSRANSLAITFRTAIAKKVELLSQYTLSKSTDDTSGMFSSPSDNFNLALERGRSDFDRRHRLNLAAIFQLPYDFKFGTITSISSGIPFNITTGLDTGDDAGAVANYRPAGVGRNTGNGPMFSQVDIRLSKKFVIVKKERGSTYLELRADAFNVLNQVNARNYVGILTSPIFGLANSAYPARQLQFSSKLSF